MDKLGIGRNLFEERGFFDSLAMNLNNQEAQIVNTTKETVEKP